MINQIGNAVKSGHGDALLYTAVITAAITDAIPTPADAAYFYFEKKLRDDWKAGNISAKQYWTREAIYYYGLNPLWWMLLLGGVALMKGNFNHKAKLAVAVVGIGAVATVIYKNIKEDIKQNPDDTPPKQ